MDLTLRPIGVVRSPYATPLDAPRQGEFATVEATLDIEPRYQEGLAGIAPGWRLLVVWWAHLADRALLSRPGTDGVFAMRTPHRPNPICLSEVLVKEVRGATLVVTGLEATEGTPILDLKAASAEYEGWTSLPTRVD